MQRQVKCEETHRSTEVREAALKLFYQHGYHAVSLRKLASELGLSAGSLYAHIESKQELLFEIIEGTQQALNYSIRRELKRAAQRNTSLLDGFVRGANSHACRERRHLLLAIRERHSLSPEQQLCIEQLRQELAVLLNQALGTQLRTLQAPASAIQVMTQSVLTTLDGFLYLPEQALSVERAVKVFASMANAAVAEILD